MKLRTSLFSYLVIFISSIAYGQIEQYSYKRELNGISEQWHKIILPDEIFEKTSQSLSDLRIFGITKNDDTIEAPYLLRLKTEKVSNKEITVRVLNASRNAKGYYFTFEIPSSEPINEINLNFKNQNFDWRIGLEGSQNQQEWFSIVDNYRILSIKNELADFQFTNLSFPNSKYKYFRIFISSKEHPELKAASFGLREIEDGQFRNFPIRKTEKKENKQTRQTEIDIELELPVPVNDLELSVADSFDYYRPVTIQYLTDSFKTEQGWRFNYSTLTTGTLNSIEENKFKFNSTTVQRLRIFIDNQNNRPLTVDTIVARGPVHEVVARFTEPATYFLAYGNQGAASPRYDIERFTENIPATLKTLGWGGEIKIEKKLIQPTDPLFKNKNWLWAIMGIVILLLGWFSLKMIRKK